MLSPITAQAGPSSFTAAPARAQATGWLTSSVTGEQRLSATGAPLYVKPFANTVTINRFGRSSSPPDPWTG